MLSATKTSFNGCYGTARTTPEELTMALSGSKGPNAQDGRPGQETTVKRVVNCGAERAAGEAVVLLPTPMWVWCKELWLTLLRAGDAAPG